MTDEPACGARRLIRYRFFYWGWRTCTHPASHLATGKWHWDQTATRGSVWPVRDKERRK